MPNFRRANRDDLFVLATALCAVQLFTSAPHSSDRPQAGDYKGGKPARAFSSGWFVVEPVASVAKFFTVVDETNQNLVETGVR
jgi:hypothetical protein